MRYLKVFVAVCLFWVGHANAAGTRFTYQGELQLSAAAAQGSFDFEFTLFDALVQGGSVGVIQQLNDVAVSNGVFTVQLDFGVSAFDGDDRWLEIAVKRTADASFETLNPRQRVTPAPYAIRSETAMVADGAVLANTADSVPFLGVTDRPAGLDDGDDDTLGALTCASDQIAVFNAGTWSCADASGDTLDALTCSNGQIPVFNTGEWNCGDQSVDTLDSLTCSNGQIPVFDGTDWQCGDPSVDTLTALSCSSGQIVVFNGATWGCGDAPSDTLAQLTCSSGQVPVFNGVAWACGVATDGDANAVCARINGDPGVVIDGVCLLDYDNTLSTTWDVAVNACAVIGGDLCTVSQYDALRGEGELTTSSFRNDLFAPGRPVWSNDFSDDDGGVKDLLLRSSDDPIRTQLYSYACCGNVLPEPTRSSAQTINGVLVTSTHTSEDTVWRGAARACRATGADLCTKSQYVALNDAALFGPTVRRATSEVSDNDVTSFDEIVGTNTTDNEDISSAWAYSCCATARPLDRSCAGSVIGGVCVLAINDVEDSNFFDAARACTSMGADICSNSQMQVIRDASQFSGQCWTASGADNDGMRAGGLLGTQPNNPDPSITLMGYACCQ